MPRHHLRRALVVAMLSGALVAGMGLAPASATPAGQAAALAQMKKDWAKKTPLVRKGTCQTYNKWPQSTIAQETNKLWSEKKNRKNMTAAEWLKVVRKFYAWAC